MQQQIFLFTPCFDTVLQETVYGVLKKFSTPIWRLKKFPSFSCLYEMAKKRSMESELLLQRLQAPVPEIEREEIRQQLEAFINHLIQTDFSRLVQLLYTVDVDEKQLKNLLHAQPEKDAATLMADLILTRQQEKAKSRQQFRKKENADDDERW